MQITKDRLESRLTELEASLEAVKQQFVLTSGAIADIKHWIAEEAKPEPDDAPHP